MTNVEQMVLNNESILRLGLFFSIFVILVMWEAIAPYRRYRVLNPLRWFNNIGIVVLSTLLVRVVCPLAAVDMGAIATTHHWGLFNGPIFSSFPFFCILIVSIIVLDLIIYSQHVLFHQIPLLWRLHKVHHADREVDVTTGLRFHPLEILLSMGIKLGAIALLGIPTIAVLGFEILLNASSLFTHGNVELGRGDRFLRWFIVTPAMHRIHHCAHIQDTHSNFGFNLTCWDRLFGTYRDASSRPITQMLMGLPYASVRPSPNKHSETLLWMLALPFLPQMSGRFPQHTSKKEASDSEEIQRFL